MSKLQRLLLSGSSLLALIFGAFVVTPAVAQDDAAAGDDTEAVEEIVTTGSRIKKDTFVAH